MRKRIILFALFVLILLPACNFLTSSVPETNNAPSNEVGTSPNEVDAPANPVSVAASDDDIFAIPSDPFRVTPTLDNANQAEAIIPFSGGTLSATGADGTRFQLDIPATALVEDTLIRLIPISSLEGMPFGSNPYAVQLEPQGQQFYNEVTLTIFPAQEIPVDQQLFFTYQGAGENLIMAVPVVDSSEIKLQLMHFSGYGVTKGLLADIEPVRARIGGDAEARISSALAEELTRARQEQLLGSAEEGTQIDWDKYFKQYEEQVVNPRVAAAGESCAAGQLALQTVLGFERQKQLLGIAGDGSGLDTGLMNTVSEVCMKEEYELCRDEHIIHRILPVYLGMQRQYQLLGLSGDDVSSLPALQQAGDYVRRCLTFELEFQSQASFDEGSDGYDSAVESKVIIHLNLDTFSNQAQAPLVNTSFEFRTEGCSVTSNRGGSTFEVYSLAYIPDTKSPTDELGYVRDFKLIYYPGNTTESFTVKCPDSISYTSPATPFWTGIYLVLHEPEMSQADSGFIAENWEIFGNEYFAKLEWIKDDASLSITEAGTFMLYHKPE
jgi:hypothetical protein